MRELILGGARSGKSRYAERCALQSGKDVIYVATAGAGDEEMSLRIAEHRRRRPPHWTTIEEPLALADALAEQADADRCVLVDCLTLWLSNALAEGDERLARERSALLQILPQLPGDIHLVSNEVGLGIVPTNPLARRFVDEAGWLHQDLAEICEQVTWVAAGLPLFLKAD